ncbi:MAG: hypothetical protein PHH04_08535 [Thomasclavelia sp.]|nr:hypothetical protein [Thomasclavelia sp.]
MGYRYDATELKNCIDRVNDKITIRNDQITALEEKMNRVIDSNDNSGEAFASFRNLMVYSLAGLKELRIGSKLIIKGNKKLISDIKSSIDSNSKSHLIEEDLRDEIRQAELQIDELENNNNWFSELVGTQQKMIDIIKDLRKKLVKQVGELVTFGQSSHNYYSDANTYFANAQRVTEELLKAKLINDGHGNSYYNFNGLDIKYMESLINEQGRKELIALGYIDSKGNITKDGYKYLENQFKKDPNDLNYHDIYYGGLLLSEVDTPKEMKKILTLSYCDERKENVHGSLVPRYYLSPSYTALLAKANLILQTDYMKNSIDGKNSDKNTKEYERKILFNNALANIGLSIPSVLNKFSLTDCKVITNHGNGHENSGDYLEYTVGSDKDGNSNGDTISIKLHIRANNTDYETVTTKFNGTSTLALNDAYKNYLNNGTMSPAVSLLLSFVGTAATVTNPEALLTTIFTSALSASDFITSTTEMSKKDLDINLLENAIDTFHLTSYSDDTNGNISISATNETKTAIDNINSKLIEWSRKGSKLSNWETNDHFILGSKKLSDLYSKIKALGLEKVIFPDGKPSYSDQNKRIVLNQLSYDDVSNPNKLQAYAAFLDYTELEKEIK